MSAPVNTTPILTDSVDAALRRFRLLRPVLEDGVALCAQSRESGVSEPTLRRWLARYRRHGMAGLQRQPRHDRGKSRCLWQPPSLTSTKVCHRPLWRSEDKIT